MPETTPWPDGVIARYLTVGGATVSVWDATEWSPLRAVCGGCGGSSRDGGPDSTSPGRWAQSHAWRCRALPRPA
jgi:hypothetical protein